MVKAPAVIVVGEVVSLRNRCTPKTKKPLLGKRVILTVSENLGKEWRNLFEDQGAEVWEIPMTRIEPLPVQKKWRARVLKSDWLVFTSAAAVRAFPAVAGDLRDISRCKIAAVGKSTAQVLRSIGLVPDWVGAGPGSKELLSGWPKKAQGRILHLTGNAGNGDLVKGLRKMGFSAERLVIYKNSAGEEVPDPVLRILRTEGADWVVFASGTAAERLRKIIPRWSTEPKVIAIGLATARSAKRVGWKVCAVAKEPSSDSVLRGILKS
jgi:uroporphyrinogen III methyltransferase/synthase